MRVFTTPTVYIGSTDMMRTDKKLVKIASLWMLDLGLPVIHVYWHFSMVITLVHRSRPRAYSMLLGVNLKR